MTDDPDAVQHWPRQRGAKPLIPYAGAEQQQRRLLTRNPTAVLEEILRRQQRGQLLSEIGDVLGSREMVRAVLLAWLFEAAA